MNDRAALLNLKGLAKLTTPLIQNSFQIFFCIQCYYQMRNNLIVQVLIFPLQF